MNLLKRLPILPTLLVLIAVAVMVRLGFWQIDRMQEKNALIAQYQQALRMSSDVPLPGDPAGMGAAMFRHSRANCRSAGADRPTAGHNHSGELGWAHAFPCRLADGGSVDVVLGWSKDPASRQWSGGEVSGMIASGGRLIADQPLPGLQPNAMPNPNNIPNNHWSYAVQWFLFAATALVIYGLALRKRLAVKDTAG